MAKFKTLSFCQKSIFMESNFFMRMFNVSTLCIQSIRMFQYKLWNELNSPYRHYLCIIKKYKGQ